MDVKEKSQIKEGDTVRVPAEKGQTKFGQVLYISGGIAEVRIAYFTHGRKPQRKQYRVDELKKTILSTEKEAKERNERETA